MNLRIFLALLLFGTGDLSVSYRDQLLGDDGEHLDIDAIEFVEAAPGTGCRQSREEPAHHLLFE